MVIGRSGGGLSEWLVSQTACLYSYSITMANANTTKRPHDQSLR